MRITNIEKYKGNTYMVSFDEGEPVFLHYEIICEYNLKKDICLPQEALEEILYSSDKRRARERALYLLTYRDHSYKELYQKLKKNYSDEICDEVCDKMEESGLIDDRRYAEKLSREYIVGKKYGEYRARAEMRQKGLDKELIDEALSEYEEDTEERLSELVERKYARYLTDRKGVQKVKAALVRQGYSYSDINAVLDDYIDETEWD